MINKKAIEQVSVVIPVYNEAASLPELLQRTQSACNRLNFLYEIILVDDGSHDESAALMVQAAQAVDSCFIAVLLNRNYGQHAAIMAGFGQAKGDIVITLDADLQNPPEAIPDLVAAASQGYDVVGTVRKRRQDSYCRRIPSWVVNWIIKKSTGQSMGDYGCMLRAYQRPIIAAMLACQERSTFIPLLANSFARRTIELKVAHAERQYGDSKYSLMQLFSLWFDLITCMTTRPLRLLSVVGCVIATVGFLLALLLLMLRLTQGSVWAAHGVFTLFAVLFAFVGVQLMGMGILGEYIGRIYNDVRARPRYFIYKVVKAQQSSAVEGLLP